MNIQQANEVLARVKVVWTLARKYALTYEQLDAVINLQRELAEYKTTYKAK